MLIGQKWSFVTHIYYFRLFKLLQDSHVPMHVISARERTHKYRHRERSREGEKERALIIGAPCLSNPVVRNRGRIWDLLATTVNHCLPLVQLLQLPLQWYCKLKINCFVRTRGGKCGQREGKNRPPRAEGHCTLCCCRLRILCLIYRWMVSICVLFSSPGRAAVAEQQRRGLSSTFPL